MKYSWFDMDHTLIDNDCDVSWKEFLVAGKLAPESALAEKDRFYEEYKAGTLDTEKFLAFQLREFVGRTPDEMNALARKHFEQYVRHTVRPVMADIVRRSLAAGDHVAIVTSTNAVIARPAADFFGIGLLLAPELALDGRGCYTGRIAGHYTVGDGKVAALMDFCRANRCSPLDFTYYGDSVNDIPMLEAVGVAVAVAPSPELRKYALQKNWHIIDL